MSQANELLDSLTTDEIAAYSADSTSEPHIIIGSDRYITVPESLKRIGVQFDHNVETVTFDCPRYWDGLDMSKMIIYINYMLPGGIRAAYIAENISVDESDSTMMHFTWTISNHVTMTKGTLSFLVCIKKTDDEGNEVNHWNSELNREMFISEGMECQEIALSEYPDIITQLLTRMTMVEQINIQAEEMETLVLQANGAAQFAITTKNEIESLKFDIDGSAAEIRDSYANAIKGNVKGEVVRVDDVSPLEHEVKCWVHGKNLFNTACITVGEGAANNSVTAVGEGFIDITSKEPYDGNGHVALSVTLRDLCPQLKAGKQYVLHATTDAWNKCIYLKQLDLFWQFGSALHVTEEMLDCTVGVYGYATYRDQEPGTCRISDIQLEQGSVETQYVPYIDPSIATITRYGKNLLQRDSDISFNGVSISTDDNNIITISGTSTAGVNMYIGTAFMKAGYKYKPTSGLISGNIELKYWNEAIGIQIHPDSDGYLSSTVDTILTVFIYAAEAGAVFNARCKPMIQLVIENEDENFEPYSKTTTVPAIDGICIVPSVSPTMTLYTDTEGVTIDLEYNRDTTKMFESYVLTDEAKSEIAGIVESDMAEVLAALNEYAETVIGGES